MANNNDIHQNADLKSIGLVLKKKREELSYTLEHVSEITRITLTCLRQIEGGNMDALPGLVFVRGFIRNYAKLLGLESDWMIEALNQTYASGQEVHAPPSETTAAGEQQQETSPQKNRFFYYSLAIGVVCAVLVAVYVLYKMPSDRLHMENSSVETVQAVASPEELDKPEEMIAKEDQAPELPANEKTESSQPAPPVISPLTLTLVALEDDWIQLAIDGQDPFQLKLKQGEKYEWPAEEEYALIMSTGQTAKIHLNGEEIVERESFQDQLYEAKLNKFTLKQINNRQ